MSGNTWATSYMLIVMTPMILCLVGLYSLIGQIKNIFIFIINIVHEVH